MSGLPNIFLWAWERPEDFTRQSLPPGIGIAYLAATIYVVGDNVKVAPRRQPLLVASTVPLITVCRIEIDERKRAALGSELSKSVCASILRYGNPKALAVQVDFDALYDERGFYRDLLQRLRRELPSSKGLSITALASWCMCDAWMQRLPIDESVPMCFSMGRDVHNILVDLKAGHAYGDARCNGSLGISIDEPGVNAVVVPIALARHPPAHTRIYVFNRNRWSFASIHRAIEIARGRVKLPANL
jgi:hypothetical protein